MMRFMMFMIPEVYQSRGRGGEPAAGPAAGEDFAPPADAVEKMTRYNEELAKAGALIALDGLTPPAKGARVSFADGTTTVTHGPFTESTEVVGGYWLIRAASLEEALEWAAKCPAGDGDIIEVRPIFEVEDMPEETQRAAESSIVLEAEEDRS